MSGAFLDHTEPGLHLVDCQAVGSIPDVAPTKNQVWGAALVSPKLYAAHLDTVLTLMLY